MTLDSADDVEDGNKSFKCNMQLSKKKEGGIRFEWGLSNINLNESGRVSIDCQNGQCCMDNETYCWSFLKVTQQELQDSGNLFLIMFFEN